MPDKKSSVSTSSGNVFAEADNVARELIARGIRWREIEDIAYVLVTIAHIEGRRAREPRTFQFLHHPVYTSDGGGTPEVNNELAPAVQRVKRSFR